MCSVHENRAVEAWAARHLTLRRRRIARCWRGVDGRGRLGRRCLGGRRSCVELGEEVGGVVVRGHDLDGSLDDERRGEPQIEFGLQSKVHAKQRTVPDRGRHLRGKGELDTFKCFGPSWHVAIRDDAGSDGLLSRQGLVVDGEGEVFPQCDDDLVYFLFGLVVDLEANGDFFPLEHDLARELQGCRDGVLATHEDRLLRIDLDGSLHERFRFEALQNCQISHSSCYKFDNRLCLHQRFGGVVDHRAGLRWPKDVPGNAPARSRCR
mmetsp:Transcript_54695/g.119055  ORF Transcript_54695/g.119055 Transcript_54695/m.119055 type:complete len:265 (-) Transcript_54695:268-1062(-)